jgi:hypothetical protein
MQPTTIQPRGSLNVSSLNRRKFIGVVEFTENVLGFGCGATYGEFAIDARELLSEGFNLRTGFLAVFLYVLVKFLDRVEKN